MNGKTEKGKQVKRENGQMAKRQVDEDWTDGNLDREQIDG